MEKFLRAFKRFYDETQQIITVGKKGIDEFLFPTDDRDTSANLALDKLTHVPHGVTYRDANESSHIRLFEPGTGQTFQIPRISEKTPIDESLRDTVVAGIEATASYGQHEQLRMTQIVRNFMIAFATTRWYDALKTLRTGIFAPIGMGGQDIGLSIDFSRDASLDIVYDFTKVGATMNEALTEALDAYRAKNGAPTNVYVLMGRKWASLFENDAEVLANMTSNTANVLLESAMDPSEFAGVQGLYRIAKYRVPGKVFSITILGYEPQYKFIPYKGAAEVDYMPDDEALIFSTNDPRFRVFRGFEVKSGGSIQRVVGEIVFDSFTSDDPVGEYIRAATRQAFIPADINRTCRATGTFEES